MTTSYVWDYHKSNEKYKIKGALPERESKSTIPTNQILLIQRPLVDRLFSKVANTYNKTDIFDVDDLVACRQHICTSDCR